MSVTRITTFHANAGHAEALNTFLHSLIPIISKEAGCQSCTVLRNVDNASQFTVIEVWDSSAAHKESAKNIPPALLAEVIPLLAAPPTGSYWS